MTNSYSVQVFTRCDGLFSSNKASVTQRLRHIWNGHPSKCLTSSEVTK